MAPSSNALLALGLLTVAAVASLPSAQAIELPSPCGPTALCEGPTCPPSRVATSDLLAYLGPHATVTVDRACNVTVEEHGLNCPAAWDGHEERRQAGPVRVVADSCTPATACTCDPVHEASAAFGLSGILDAIWLES